MEARAPPKNLTARVEPSAFQKAQGRFCSKRTLKSHLNRHDIANN